jgi:prolipoprotein diacylglyceryltransferase
VWRGGLAYCGGLIFAAVFGLYYARKEQRSRAGCIDGTWLEF